MKQQITLTLAALVSAMIFWAPYLKAEDQDPGKPDTVRTESIKAKAGKQAIIGMKIFADDSIFYNDKPWVGVGSLCIPLKYDANAFKLDSIKYTGTLAQWDEKFTNPRIDTGFVSIGGIYSIAGKDRPLIHCPDSSQTMALLYITVNKTAKPGAYKFEMTDDPVQKEAYLGSPNGVNGWKPVFASGKIVIEK